MAKTVTTGYYSWPTKGVAAANKKKTSRAAAFAAFAAKHGVPKKKYPRYAKDNINKPLTKKEKVS